METSLLFCEGFHFPANSNSTLSLRIQNLDWVVGKKIVQGLYQQNYGTYQKQLIIELHRPLSLYTETFDVVLIIYKESPSSSIWEKYKKNGTFSKNQKTIEILVCDWYPNLFGHTTNNQVGNLIGLIYVSVLDSCKTDDKKSASAVISSQLSKDFATLLNSDTSSDYVLRCAGQEFHVHKCILAARSSVFAAMFRFYNQTDEAQDSMIKAETRSSRKRKIVQDCIPETSTTSNQAEEIADIKPEILKKLLKYIYSGQIDDITSTEAGALLYAADKYQLELLKKICLEKLKSTLSASNVLDTLVLGDLHDQSLKAHAMDFISKYPSLSELKKMDQWKSLQNTNPTMVIEVLTSVVGYLQDFKK